jgi:hypothetical protein
MPPSEDQTAMNVNILVSIARLEEQIKAVNSKLDDAVVSRAHLEERLAPLTENMNRWKGGIAAITLVAGSVGAVISTFVKNLFLNGSSP